MRIGVGLVAVGVLVLGGCGASPVEPAATRSLSSTGTASPSTSAPASSSKCLDASKLAPGILTASTVGALTVAKAKAVKSPDFKNVFFVAVEFEGASGGIGVWATNSLEPGGGRILSVDSKAIEVTDWPGAATTDAGITSDDPSVDAAVACLG